MSAWVIFRGAYFWAENKIKKYKEYIRLFYGVYSICSLSLTQVCLYFTNV